MKIYWKCRFFGHKFWGRKIGSTIYRNDEGSTWVEEAKGCCVKCGLSKEEIKAEEK